MNVLVGIVILLFVGAVVVVPSVFALAVFYLAPFAALSWAIAEIIFIACAGFRNGEHHEGAGGDGENTKGGRIDLSVLPLIFAVLGCVSFVALRLYGFRELNKKGELIISSFGQELYGAFNSMNETVVMFSPIFRPTRYTPEIYDDKSLLWICACALTSGVPAVLYWLTHFRGYPAFSGDPSKTTRELAEARAECDVLHERLYAASHTESDLRVKLTELETENTRMKEDHAAFQKGAGGDAAPAGGVASDKGTDVPQLPKGTDVDSDTL